MVIKTDSRKLGVLNKVHHFFMSDPMSVVQNIGRYAVTVVQTSETLMRSSSKYLLPWTVCNVVPHESSAMKRSHPTWNLYTACCIA